MSAPRLRSLAQGEPHRLAAFQKTALSQDMLNRQLDVMLGRRGSKVKGNHEATLREQGSLDDEAVFVGVPTPFDAATFQKSFDQDDAEEPFLDEEFPPYPLYYEIEDVVALSGASHWHVLATEPVLALLGPYLRV